MAPRVRPAKRPRTNDDASCPPCWMHVASLTHVPVPPRSWVNNVDNDDSSTEIMVETKLASVVQKEIFLDRLQKEIVDRFNFRLQQAKPSKEKNKEENSRHQSPKEEEEEEQQVAAANKARRRILKDCIRVGLSVCSKALSKNNGATIDLLVVASDFEPVRSAAHLPVLARQRNIPILLLPDASIELGKVLGVRCVGVVAFTLQGAAATSEECNTQQQAKMIHDKLESFLSFVKTNMM